LLGSATGLVNNVDNTYNTVEMVDCSVVLQCFIYICYVLLLFRIVEARERGLDKKSSSRNGIRHIIASFYIE